MFQIKLTFIVMNTRRAQTLQNVLIISSKFCILKILQQVCQKAVSLRQQSKPVNSANHKDYEGGKKKFCLFRTNLIFGCLIDFLILVKTRCHKSSFLYLHIFFLRYLKSENKLCKFLINLTATIVHLSMLAHQKSGRSAEMVVGGRQISMQFSPSKN